MKLDTFHYVRVIAAPHSSYRFPGTTVLGLIPIDIRLSLCQNRQRPTSKES
jgi:hypothetical protein